MILPLTFLFSLFCSIWASQPYKLGVGIYDMTGPAAEINFMGYAVPSQRGTGIHQRLRARAFYFGDNTDSSSNKQLLFISVDGGMGSDLVKMRVVDNLVAKYGDMYSVDNVCITGTHTHSGPAGFLQYALFQITSWGFVQETFDAWVNGITEAAIMAHESARPGHIKIAQGTLYDSNINRSPTSYELNPEDEKAQYPDGNTDKTMTLIHLLDENEKTIGLVNWFAVHATSMNNTNTLISGDNKGYASYLMEKELNNGALPGMGPIVAAFASSNLGDISPNTAGPKCIDTGLPCDGSTSTCNGKCQNCIAFGPGTNGDMFESTQIIGANQYNKAKELLDGPKADITGSIDYRHTFIDMPNLKVKLNDSSEVQLCSPAMGYSFAAGTTDGPGMMNFTQGTTSGNPFWDKVRDFLSTPTEEEIACQAPKPILFNTGDMDQPYPWDPHVLPVQLFKIGNLFIANPPAEFTTMAGRRLRKAIQDTIRASNLVAPDETIYVTISGLANSYSSYVTTFEEYQAQRYEAASTIFGPHSLEGYIQEYTRITKDLVTGQPSVSTATPPDLTDVQVSYHVRKFPFDRTPIGTKFGDVVEGKDASSSYKLGEQVSVTFHSANPRNDQRIQSTFLSVDRQEGHRWVTVAVDGDWETKYSWKAGPEDPLNIGLAGQSESTITWNIPEDASNGTYRICHYGAHKTPKEEIVQFSGCSSTFTVSA